MVLEFGRQGVVMRGKEAYTSDMGRDVMKDGLGDRHAIV